MFLRLAGAFFVVVALVSAASPASAQRCGDIVVVRPGETIDGIARRCGVDRRMIYDANPGLRGGLVRPGDRLRMPYVQTDVDITVSPNAGPPGSTVTVVASGLRPYDTVQLGVSDGAFGFRSLVQARADASGRVVTEMVVPRDGDRDGRMRFAVATAAGRVLARSRTFDVAYDRGWRGGPGGPPISVTGVVTHEGRSCPAMRDRDGNLYSLAEHAAPFRPGDIVAVEGRVIGRSRCDLGTTVQVTRIRKIGETHGAAPPGSIEALLGAVLNQVGRAR